MKKSIILSAVGVLAMGLVSCNDFLNDNRYPMDTQVSTPEYWSNESNVSLQCDNLYQNFTGFATGTSGLFYFQTLNDNQGSAINNAFATWKNTNVPTSSSAWSNPYTQIRHCNEIITGVASSTLADATKNKYIGIARLIRAQQYYQLVRCYGDVPYLDVVPNVTETELIYQPRVDRDVVMDKVWADLDFACNNITGSSKTTWSKNMAYAMTSEICLYEGTYCKYRTVAENYKAADPARAKTYLERCVAASQYLLNAGYSLNETYIGNYNSVDLSKNPEMIFYKNYKQAVLSHQTIQYITNTTTIAGISKDAFDSFLFRDGKPLCSTTLNTSDAGYVKDGCITAGTGANATLGKVLYIGDLLDVRDARLAQTVDTVLGYGTTAKGMTWARVGTPQLSSSTGYLIRKYDNPEDIPLTYRTGSNYTMAPVYWLAVTMCEYAEAKAELGTLTDDDLNLTLNKLYVRAQLPPQTVASLSSMNDTANNMGISSLLWEVRRCRRCETMMDNDYRYWDLIRWHQLDKLDTKKYPNIALGANIGDVAGAPTDAVVMTGKYLRAAAGNERVFEARQYLYPIPSLQLTLTKLPGSDEDAPSVLTQNELWK